VRGCCQARQRPSRNSIAGVLEVRGPTLTLRYPVAGDAPALLELGSDALTTRWFSWGPYTDVAQPLGYIEGLEAKRDAGVLLDFLVVHEQDGPLGITGLSEVSARDRRATVGTWFARAFWGSGANRESKALIAALAFEHLGFNRLTAWANTRNGRSQTALERSGFVREGVLRGWHVHDSGIHDVVVFRLLREEWAASPLAAVPVTVSGTAPAPWHVGAT
jgi:ribosomal-protein-alanine N-acetyltransferase